MNVELRGTPVEGDAPGDVEQSAIVELASYVAARLQGGEHLLNMTAEHVKKLPQQTALRRDWEKAVLKSIASADYDPGTAHQLLEKLERVCALITDDGHEKAIRGAVLEEIVIQLVRPRYDPLQGRLFEGRLFERDCRVVVNGRYVSGSGKEIDVAGWDPSIERGEFFEVKSSAASKAKIRERDKLLYLQKLADAIQVAERERVVALACWRSKSQVNRRYDDSDWADVTLLGREDFPRMASGLVDLP